MPAAEAAEINPDRMTSVRFRSADRSESLDKLIPALIKVQKEMGFAEKDAKNPHFKSSYATLASAWQAAKEPLTKNGFALTQPTEPGCWGGQATLYVITTLWHESGQWLSCRTPAFNSKGDMQGLGSAVTYARRYGLMAIINLAPGDDDDGNAATGRPPPPAQKTGHPLDNMTPPPRHEDETGPEVERIDPDERARFLGFENADKHASFVKLIFVKGKQSGWSEEDIRQYMAKTLGLTSTKELTWVQGNSLIKHMLALPKKKAAG